VDGGAGASQFTPAPQTNTFSLTVAALSSSAAGSIAAALFCCSGGWSMRRCRATERACGVNTSHVAPSRNLRHGPRAGRVGLPGFAARRRLTDRFRLGDQATTVVPVLTLGAARALRTNGSGCTRRAAG
jgi:hypothetical protein